MQNVPLSKFVHEARNKKSCDGGLSFTTKIIAVMRFKLLNEPVLIHSGVCVCVTFNRGASVDEPVKRVTTEYLIDISDAAMTKLFGNSSNSNTPVDRVLKS